MTSHSRRFCTRSACTRRRRSLRREHRRVERAPADQRPQGPSSRRLRSARPNVCAGRATTAPRSKAGSCSRTATIRPKGRTRSIVTSHGGPHAATGYTFDFKDQYFAANGYFVFDTQLPELDGLRRRLQVGHVGRMGPEGRRGRRLGHRLRAEALSDRRQARGPHRPFVRRLHDELADHAISRSVCGRNHRRRHLELDHRTTAPPTSTGPRKPSSSARRGRRTRATA